MRFIAERDTILAAMTFAAKYAMAGDKIPVLSDVLFVADGPTVTVTSTDLDRTARDSFDADIKSAGSACLPATLLLKAIKSSSGTEVEIVALENVATVTIGRSRFSFPTLAADDFPEMRMLTSDAPCNFEIAADVIHRIKKEVEFATSDDAARYHLSGVSWKIGGRNIEFCATDGHKLAMAAAPAPTGSANLPHVIVPCFDIPAWQGDVRVSVSDLFIRLTCGRQTVASKLVEGTFPDYHRIIPRYETRLLMDRQELLQAITRATINADGRGHSILFVGRDGKISVLSSTKFGDIADVVPYEGDDFQMALASGVSASVLNSFDCEMVELRINDHECPATVHDPKDEFRVAVAMPMRDQRLREYTGKMGKAA